MGLLTKACVAIDGSKFKAVNNRDKNFTRAKMERRRGAARGERRALSEPARHGRSAGAVARRSRPKTARLKEKLDKLKEEMASSRLIEKQMLASPDQQISLTDPDSRSMATSGRGSGVVGYNVQVAVDTEHHLIVTHEVTNSRLGSVTACERGQAGEGGRCEAEKLDAVADRGYFNSAGDPGVR